MAMRLRLRELRKKRDWTIDHVASQLGASKSFISEIETGKKNPSAPMMDALAKLFDVPVVRLYDAGAISDDLELIAAELKQMTPEQRRQAVRLVQTLRER